MPDMFAFYFKRIFTVSKTHQIQMKIKTWKIASLSFTQTEIK